MKNFITSLLLGICALQTATAQVDHTQPLKVVSLIGDKLIAETPFRYRIDVAPNNDKLDCMHFVDFGRSLLRGKAAMAYAYTELMSDNAMDMAMELEHNDAMKMWLNGELIYERRGAKEIDLIFEERSIEMPQKLTLKLKKGINKLLIKSQTMGGERWICYLQPQSLKGAVDKQVQYPSIGLGSMKEVDARVAELSAWLVAGPFAADLDCKYEPEEQIAFGKVYKGLNGEAVVWSIPKVDLLGTSIDAQPWGTNYDWNYHNGGVAWAMQVAAEATGNAAYGRYAANFCDFHLDGEPFVRHQVRGMNYVNSANHFFIDTPLLDFTLAPSLPFIYRLRTEKSFDGSDRYSAFIDRMLKYSRTQIRHPETGVYTRVTPEVYTTWVDDMFMGIPFLVQASQYCTDPAQRKEYLDDAAQQTVEFTKHVWDKDAQLYMHANYSQRPDVKLPHWSRANGWAIWATSEVLKVLPKNHRHYKTILEQYRRHVASIVRFQTEEGFWYNVIEYPDSREEVSGTAIFTMAIARGVTNGWLDAKTYAPIAMKGWEAIVSRIDTEGNVEDICYGTMCTEDVNYYAERPFYVNDTHGLFAVIFAGIEVDKMSKTASNAN